MTLFVRGQRSIPGLFAPAPTRTSGTRTGAARSSRSGTCRACPVRCDCVAQGVAQSPTIGLWGGLGQRGLNRLRNRGVASARVNLFEADFFGNHCVVAGSSFGSLIHTAVGSAGGWGGLRTNRSGLLA